MKRLIKQQTHTVHSKYCMIIAEEVNEGCMDDESYELSHKLEDCKDNMY